MHFICVALFYKLCCTALQLWLVMEQPLLHPGLWTIVLNYLGWMIRNMLATVMQVSLSRVDTVRLLALCHQYRLDPEASDGSQQYCLYGWVLRLQIWVMLTEPIYLYLITDSQTEHSTYLPNKRRDLNHLCIPNSFIFPDREWCEEEIWVIDSVHRVKLTKLENHKKNSNATVPLLRILLWITSVMSIPSAIRESLSKWIFI